MKAASLLLHAKALLIALGLLQLTSGGSSNSQSLYALHRQWRFYSNFKGFYHLHPNREKTGWRADQIVACENRETEKAVREGVKVCRKSHPWFPKGAGQSTSWQHCLFLSLAQSHKNKQFPLPLQTSVLM